MGDIMPTGLRLAFVHASYQAMNHVFGGPLHGAELSAVIMASLDMVPRGVRACRIILPERVYVDCYNAAHCECLDIQADQFWRPRTHSRRRHG